MKDHQPWHQWIATITNEIAVEAIAWIKLVFVHCHRVKQRSTQHSHVMSWSWHSKIEIEEVFAGVDCRQTIHCVSSALEMVVIFFGLGMVTWHLSMAPTTLGKPHMVLKLSSDSNDLCLVGHLISWRKTTLIASTVSFNIFDTLDLPSANSLLHSSKPQPWANLNKEHATRTITRMAKR